MSMEKIIKEMKSGIVGEIKNLISFNNDMSKEMYRVTDIKLCDDELRGKSIIELAIAMGIPDLIESDNKITVDQLDKSLKETTYSMIDEIKSHSNMRYLLENKFDRICKYPNKDIAMKILDIDEMKDYESGNFKLLEERYNIKFYEEEHIFKSMILDLKTNNVRFHRILLDVQDNKVIDLKTGFEEVNREQGIDLFEDSLHILWGKE